MKLLLQFPLLALVAFTSLHAAERVALVIGNDAYRHGTPLKNCVNDAKAIAGALRNAGFEVIVAENASLEQMEAKALEFRRAAAGAKAAWFHYSGHGAEVRGANYLIPVDANVQEEFQVRARTFALDQVLGAMEAADTPLKVVVLDCCRDNPFGRGWSRSGSAGLAQVGDTPAGTIIAFATSPGKVAADGQGANSPFTAALVGALNTPGLDVKDVFNETGRRVLLATNKNQQPWINSSFFDHFVLLPQRLPPPTQQASSAPAPAPAVPVVAAVSPPPASSGPTLPSRGFFGMDELYGSGPYAAYNSHTKSSILRRAQQKLKDAGLYASTVDGSPGPGTQRALITWQQTNGVMISGKLDAATLRAMGLEGIGQVSPPASRPRPNISPPRPAPQAPSLPNWRDGW